MTYQEFITHICSILQEHLGPGARIAVQDITKNNDTHLDGLTVLSGSCNFSPTVYLNPCFRQYQKGRCLDEICDEILSVFRDNQPSGNVDVSFFTDYDKVKSRIVFQLVSYERNRTRLSDVPHRRFLDLAVVFCCLLDSGPLTSATILIHNRHLDFWDITEDELAALAVENTPRLLTYELTDLADVLQDLAGNVLPEAQPDDVLPAPLYVLSNRNRRNGSGCILYRDLLKEFADRLGSDLYILPSSIHEVLLLPVCGGASAAELSGMVRDINRSQLAAEEILSDHVYYFSRETCEITM